LTRADFLRRACLVCAIAFTIALVWASIMPSAGQAFAGAHHRSAHLVSFAILAFTWHGALARVPAWIVALCVIGFGFLHEGVEVYGHVHPYELNDALIDAAGGIAGVLLAQLAMKR
jgi:hypothetical protein